MSDREDGRRQSGSMDRVVRYLIEHGISVSTMESCTSGLVASGITDTEGASAIFRGAFITYSNEAKVRQGVSAWLIEQYGVYSAEVAEAMAQACRKAYDARIGIGVTGTTGNVDPENADSVAGEIYYALCFDEAVHRYRMRMDTAGMSRHEIKQRIVDAVAESLRELLKIKG